MLNDIEKIAEFINSFSFKEAGALSFVEKIGLYHDDRREIVYGADIKYMRPSIDGIGLWQIPGEIEALLEELKDKQILSFLEVGTFQGFTYLLLKKFLTELNKYCSCLTIDPTKWFKQKLFDLCGANYEQKTSDDFVGKHFDLVFIDGDHTYDCALADFNNVGRHASICVFHDINDIYCEERCHKGGVPVLWRELRQLYRHTEIKKQSDGQRIMGIGVLYLT
jgi:SAM-dependent methyltransferase